MPIYQIIFWNEAITNSALCFFFSLSSRTWDWQWRFVEEVQLTKLFCLPTREAYFGHIPCIHQCCPSKCYAFMLFIIFFKWITINFKIIKKWCTLVKNHLQLRELKIVFLILTVVGLFFYISNRFLTSTDVPSSIILVCLSISISTFADR